MAAFDDIRTALETLLDNYSDSSGLDVAWPNVKFRPTWPDPFLRAFHLPSETDKVGLEVGGSEDYSGIFQVDVNVGRGDGTSDTRTHVDGVLTAFSRGTRQTANGTEVLIEQSWAGPAIERAEFDKQWYTIPVSIRYRAFV